MRVHELFETESENAVPDFLRDSRVGYRDYLIAPAADRRRSLRIVIA
jgi:hypothetical protein